MTRSCTRLENARMTRSSSHEQYISLSLQPCWWPNRAAHPQISKCRTVPARWVEEVPAGIFRVHRTVLQVGGVSGPVQRVFVEAALLGHALRVVHVRSVAQEDLEVPLRVALRKRGSRICRVPAGDDLQTDYRQENDRTLTGLVGRLLRMDVASARRGLHCFLLSLPTTTNNINININTKKRPRVSRYDKYIDFVLQGFAIEKPS